MEAEVSGEVEAISWIYRPSCPGAANGGQSGVFHLCDISACLGYSDALPPEIRLAFYRETDMLEL